MKRFVARTLALAAGVLLTAGCTNDKPTGPGPIEPLVSGTGQEKTQSGENAREFAAKFLVNLGGGKAESKDLAKSFKRVIAPPSLFQEEQKAGYSESAAKKWIDDRGLGLTFIGTDTLDTPSQGIIQRGDVTGPTLDGKTEKYALRVEKEDGGWKVQWFNRAKSAGKVDRGGHTELTLARDVLQNFLDALTNGELSLAEGLMTPALRFDLGGEPLQADKTAGRPYDRATLQTKLRRYGDYKTYEVTKQDMQPTDKIAQFRGDFLGDGDKKKPFQIRIGKDESGQLWVVESFSE